IRRIFHKYDSHFVPKRVCHLQNPIQIWKSYPIAYTPDHFVCKCRALKTTLPDLDTNLSSRYRRAWQPARLRRFQLGWIGTKVRTQSEHSSRYLVGKHLKQM